MPLHPNKLRQRGFNQAQIMCDRLHKALHIPILLNCIHRAKETLPQEGLSIKKRERNLNNAFRCEPTSRDIIKGKNIVIIDDVVTTGATINSLCKLLTQQGANNINVFCISRTAIDK